MRRPGSGGGGITLVSISVTPDTPNPTLGMTVQMTATGTYSDASTTNLTSAVTWASTDTAALTVSNGSGGGIITAVGVGSSTISATFGAISGNTVASVTGATFRSSGPIPDATTTFGGTDAVLAFAIPITSDAASFKLRLANRVGTTGGAGSSVTSNIAVYQSDGTGKPTGSAFGSWTSQTVPGDGSELVLGPISVTRGSDGCVVVLYSVPASSTLSEARFQNWGAYVNGTTTVNPAPGGWSDYTLGLFCINVEYVTGKRRLIVLGDSISIGASPVSPPGFLASAWNKVLADTGYAVGSFGQSGTKLQQWADSVTNAGLWVDQLFSGSDVYIELGVNDLFDQSAAQMESSLTAIVNNCRASGCEKIYANTIAPDSTYIASDAQRIAYNSWLMANSLGLDGIVDLAQSQATGGMANNSDPTLIYAGFDAGDGIHWNATGHIQAAAAIEAVIG